MCFAQDFIGGVLQRGDANVQEYLSRQGWGGAFDDSELCSSGPYEKLEVLVETFGATLSNIDVCHSVAEVRSALGIWGVLISLAPLLAVLYIF